MIVYHVAERSKVPDILSCGLFPGRVPNRYDVRGIFFVGNREGVEDILYWEDFEEPIVLRVSLPSDFPLHIDEAGKEIYPDACPMYTTRHVPSKYIRAER